LTSSSKGAWLYGPLPDLLLGCGLGYAILAAALLSWGPAIQSVLPFDLLPFVLLFTGAPHYGATLLRVYEKKEDFRKYLFFSLFASGLVWALFCGGVYNRALMHVLVTLYLSWSPWHYSGQNYGIAIMLLLRRGLAIPAPAKRLLHASFTLSFLLALLGMHGAGSAVYVPGDGEPVQFLRLGIPDRIFGAAHSLVLVLFIAATAGTFYQLKRRGSWRDLVPVVAMTLTQSLWFVVPEILGRWPDLLPGGGPFGPGNAAYTFAWVAVFHMVQYLWVTSYYAEGSKLSLRHGTFYVKALLAGSAIWAIPALLFAPTVLGAVPFDGGLGVLLAAAVNLHHFILDGAIWKLRDGAVARLLLRARGATVDRGQAENPAVRGLSRLRYAAWPVGAASLAVLYVASWLSLFGVERAYEANDLEGLKRAAGRERWIGREGHRTKTYLALLEAGTGDLAGAISSGEGAVASFDTAFGWNHLGTIYEMAGRMDDAIDASRHAVAADAGYRQAAIELSRRLVRAAEKRPERLDEAVAYARFMVEASGGLDAGQMFVLARALELAGLPDEARSSAARAAALTKTLDPDLLGMIESLLRRLDPPAKMHAPES